MNLCKAILKSGKRKGECCGNKVKGSGSLCGHHSKGVKAPKGNLSISLTFGGDTKNYFNPTKKVGDGFSNDEVLEIMNKFPNTELVKLHSLKPTIESAEFPDALVLIIRGGLKAMDIEPEDLKAELLNSDWDAKRLWYGKVVNRHSSLHLCWATEASEPNYEAGEGRRVAFKDSPVINDIRGKIAEFIHPKAKEVDAEGILYKDVNENYLGWHGDGERKMVIGMCVGGPRKLRWRWYQKSKVVSEIKEVFLEVGDVYIMSEKASGNDWLKKNIYTLRHSAGAIKK